MTDVFAKLDAEIKRLLQAGDEMDRVLRAALRLERLSRKENDQ
jgi:hypothetical protein